MVGAAEKATGVPRIAALEDIEGWSIQVAALTEMLGLSRSTYNSLATFIRPVFPRGDT